MSGPRVLVVLPSPPDREGGAAARCAVGLLEGLEELGVQWRALAPADGSRPLSTESPSQVEYAPPSSLSAWEARWRRLVNPGGALVSGRFAERLLELAADVDVVHLFEVSVGRALSRVERPTVLQVHCLSARDRDVWRSWRGEDRDAIETMRVERAALRRAEWLLVNSRQLADELPRTAAHAHTALAPLSLDPAHYRRRASLERPVAGLIGTARWPPTANAVRRLLTCVWPLILELRPDARLLLAGNGMDAAAFGAPARLSGVQWCGAVPSASEFIRDLGVLLYPLTRGSGTKVKVLEALALGVPVVSTQEGAEGLVDHRGVAIREDDLAIAHATVGLLDDLEARREAGEQGHRNFLENHAPALATAPVVRLYERMIDAQAGSCRGRYERRGENRSDRRAPGSPR